MAASWSQVMHACPTPVLTPHPHPTSYPKHLHAQELGGQWPLTDFTTSGFWSPKGLVTEAPVFSKLPRLPTLLGQFVHTAPLFWALPLEVRGCSARVAHPTNWRFVLPSESGSELCGSLASHPHGPPVVAWLVLALAVKGVMLAVLAPALYLQERLTMLPFLLSFVDFDASPEVYERYVTDAAGPPARCTHVALQLGQPQYACTTHPHSFQVLAACVAWGFNTERLS